MGEGMAANLLKAGRKLVVWNRGPEKSAQLAKAYPGLVTVAASAGEVVALSEVTFAMLSTLEASEAVFPSMLAAMAGGKSLVDCATLTPERMECMAGQVESKGGRFLEAPVSGSKGPAAAGQLIFLCGGSASLYEQVSPELDLMGKAKFLFGATGAGTKMKLVVNMTMGSMLATLAEGAALAEAADLSQAQLLEVLDLGVMSNMLFKLKGPAILSRDHANTQFPLKHAQKDMRFALGLGDDLGQSLPLCAAANEQMKLARSLGHQDDDFSAVYEAARAKPRTPNACAVLLDFDGTLGDTETPAMEVAFWELSPYLPGVSGAAAVQAQCQPFIVANAGKAFEFMCESVDKDRAAQGLPPLSQVATAPIADAALAQLVDARRAAFGLEPYSKAVATYPDLLVRQKEETVIALGATAQANPFVLATLAKLRAAGTSKQAIATTSGKPRVPVCVDKCGLRPFFPAAKIHSGESDFTPPRFKPAPDVYLLAAASERTPPSLCVAVEDSASGVGSAANAKMGLIVGYVGATHISDKTGHAAMLMRGEKSTDGRGADVVIERFDDLFPLVEAFNAWAEAVGTAHFQSLLSGQVAEPFDKAKLAAIFGALKGQYWA
eukprot:CAMPEP_0172585006 /NCGR_PEP_ID=MMETSP1068-20121228/4502_1 /TAXON_ID=35684 /ORGANISM="Pseudopedinella elastica, Strain CCMP716" /LENGTH=607 /DNA_ID=CAMNT_0013379333 /DNA_START=199 /DNA_END=2022 /DNA_ORIENTATION=-